MKGHTFGLQAQLLRDNSIYFVPCAKYNYNILLGDVVKCCPDTITFLGFLQTIYMLLLASTKNCEVFRKHLPLSYTRRDCRIDSIKAIRYQVGEVYDAVFDVSEITNESKVKRKLNL